MKILPCPKLRLRAVIIKLCILQDNVAHSSGAGAGIISEKLNKGTVDSDCNYVPNFYMWRNFDFGIYLQVRNLHKNIRRNKFELSRHNSWLIQTYTPTTGLYIVLFCGLIFTNYKLRDCARSRRGVSYLNHSKPLCSLNSMPSLASSLRALIFKEHWLLCGLNLTELMWDWDRDWDQNGSLYIMSKPSHCNLCGNLNGSHTVALYQSQ